MQIGDKVMIKSSFFSCRIMGKIEAIDGNMYTVRFDIPIKGRIHDSVTFSNVYPIHEPQRAKPSKKLQSSLESMKEGLRKIAR